MIDHQPTTCQKFYRQQGARQPGDIISYRRATSSRNQRATSSESAAKVLALLVNPNTWLAERLIHNAQEAVAAKGVQLSVLEASTESEIDAAFTTLDQLHAGGLMVVADPFLDSRQEQLVTLAAHHAVPVIYALREFVVAGGLISYGASFPATFRLAGIYAGKILSGAKPADLPVQQPTRFELVVNLKTAKELGLTVPPSILARADEVIE